MSVPNLPERLEKEQSVNSNLVFPSPNLPEPLDKKRGVDNNLVFSSPNLPEPLDKEQGVDSNLAFSSPSLPGSTDKGQDVDNSLRFSAKNIAETLAKEQDVVKNFSNWSLPAEPLYKERDTGTDFKLSAPTSDCLDFIYFEYACMPSDIFRYGSVSADGLSYM